MTKQVYLNVSSSATTATTRVGALTASGFSAGPVDLSNAPKGKPAVTSGIEKAVYAHIRALRALGHTQVNTAEIARALSLTVQDVEQAAKSLKSKGVNVAA